MRIVRPRKETAVTVATQQRWNEKPLDELPRSERPSWRARRFQGSVSHRQAKTPVTARSMRELVRGTTWMAQMEQPKFESESMTCPELTG